MAAVEVLRILAIMADEELRTARILAGMGHREHAAIVVLTRCRRLALDRIAGASRAIAFRAAALNDEIGNYAVECEPVVEVVIGKFYEIGYRTGSLGGVKFCFPRPFLGGDDGLLFLVGHMLCGL